MFGELGVYTMHGDKYMPSFKTTGAACFDVRACLAGVEVTVYDRHNDRYICRHRDGRDAIDLDPGDRALIPTGLKFQIPTGYSLRAHIRSGIAIKQGLTLINGEGVIDSDYIDEVFIPVINTSDVGVQIKDGDRIAQMEMVKSLSYSVGRIDEPPINDGVRQGGFGSTGSD